MNDGDGISRKEAIELLRNRKGPGKGYMQRFYNQVIDGDILILESMPSGIDSNESAVKTLDVVHERWANKHKSNIVKWLMKKRGLSHEETAKILGVSKSYFNNKLFRDSFSFEDLLMVAYSCGYDFILSDGNSEEYKVIDVPFK